MTLNDVFLIIVWGTGIIGIGIAVINARRKVRAETQMLLDKASFEAAQSVIVLLKEQRDELYNELKTMREEWVAMKEEMDVVNNKMKALIAREGKLLNRIKDLEAILKANNITIPNGGEL